MFSKPTQDNASGRYNRNIFSGSRPVQYYSNTPLQSKVRTYNGLESVEKEHPISSNAEPTSYYYINPSQSKTTPYGGSKLLTNTPKGHPIYWPSNIDRFTPNHVQEKPDIISDKSIVREVLFGKHPSTKVLDSDEYKNWSDVVLVRLPVIFGGEFKIVEDGTEPNDVFQGQIGDCYLLSVIAAIAVQEKRLRAIFVDQEVTKDGLYRIVLYRAGMREEIVVNDYIPCRWENGKWVPIFARPHGNEAYVLLLEKAWAVFNGCYYNIISGFSDEPLRHLMHAPVQTFMIEGDPARISYEEETDIWEAICHGRKNKFIMEVGTRCNADESTGLVKSHAYTLLEYGYASDETRFLRLRNPWGNVEERETFHSDNPFKWTKKQKEKLKIKTHSDGTFWIPFKAVLKFFDEIQICQYNEEDNYQYLQFERQDVNCFTIKFNQSGRHVITVHQENQRKYRNREHPQAVYDNVQISVFRHDGSCWKIVGCVEESRRELDLEIHVKPSDVFLQATYQIQVRVDPRTESREPKKYTISCYSSSRGESEKL